MKEAVIVSLARTAVGKAPRGTLRTTRPDEMAATVVRALLAQTPALDPAQQPIGDPRRPPRPSSNLSRTLVIDENIEYSRRALDDCLDIIHIVKIEPMSHSKSSAQGRSQ